VRAVLDVNVVVSALLSPTGAPAQILRAWQTGSFELVVSPSLIAELERTLAYPKLRRYVDPGDARRVTEWLTSAATMVSDPDGAPSHRSADPDDDYLLALAEAERAALVSGDRHLLSMPGELPIFAPADFLKLLAD
jgi:uncharacterized protein